MLKASIKELNHLLGNIDIYLLDQILKARFVKDEMILDAGCGDGRNLIYFVREHYNVYGIDRDADNIRMLQYLVKSINKAYPRERFSTGLVEQMPYEDQHFHVVLSSAVLHFAENRAHFIKMFSEHVRVMRPGGTLFIRMATDIGLEKAIRPVSEGKYLLPDGSVRFLLTTDLLQEMMQKFNLEFIEPFKTVIVENMRSMSSIVLLKR